jgi:hypothetical protein
MSKIMNAENEVVAQIAVENLEIDSEALSIEEIATREVQMCMCICTYGLD